MKLIELLNNLKDDTQFVVFNKHDEQIFGDYNLNSNIRYIGPEINEYDEPIIIISIDVE